MTDDLKTRLRWAADNSDGCGKWNCDPADLDAAADRIEELEAKLKKAVEALVEVQEFVKDLEPYAEQGHTLVPALQKACTVYAELTGGKDD